MGTVACVLVSVLLAQAPTSPELEERARPRFRGALAVGAAGGLGFAYPVWSVGPAVTFDLGVTLNDVISLSLRGTAAPFGRASTYLAGFSVDRALSDQLSLGVGLAGAAVGLLAGEDAPLSLGVVMPVRVAWMFSRREPEGVWRRGFFLFGEAAPGVSVAGSAGLPQPGVASPGPVSFLVTATLGVGYGGW